MSGFLKCARCRITFLRSDDYVAHHCAQPPRNIEDTLTRLEQSVFRHPSASSTRGDAS